MRVSIDLATPAQFSKAEVEPEFTVDFDTKALTGFKRFYDPVAGTYTVSKPWSLDGNPPDVAQYHGALLSIIAAQLGPADFAGISRELMPFVRINLSSNIVSCTLQWKEASGRVVGGGPFHIVPPVQILGAAASLVASAVQARDPSLAGTINLTV